ncbi:ribosomal L7Ae/L30e/S12e/Gadd45 family protein [Oscillospiraceae bacterium NTUH-002-81]|nr:ribosomal L7Ae/L30e/S12e/Gadd45 family protein [Oscillospiraceae bacterium NTUH-002-81]
MPVMEKKVLSLLGLSAKSGNLVSGEFSTEKAVKEHKAALVVVAEDASDNTKKSFSNMCAYYHVPMIVFADKETLGHAIGKQFRASVAVTQDGFAKAILKLTESDN